MAKDKMGMGLSSVSALHSAVWIAERKGLFRKYGIDAEVIVTGQGGAVGISALLANDIQLVASAGDALSKRFYKVALPEISVTRSTIPVMTGNAFC